MNKRSAIALAGGTAAALVSGVAGYSLSLTQATAQATTAEKPIVRTEVRTITIHKKPKVKQARSGSSAPITITVHRSIGSSGSSQHPSKPPAHHSGGSGHHGGGGDDDGHEGHDGGGGDD